MISVILDGGEIIETSAKNILILEKKSNSDKLNLNINSKVNLLDDKTYEIYTVLNLDNVLNEVTLLSSNGLERKEQINNLKILNEFFNSNYNGIDLQLNQIVTFKNSDQIGRVININNVNNKLDILTDTGGLIQIDSSDLSIIQINEEDEIIEEKRKEKINLKNIRNLEKYLDDFKKNPSAENWKKVENEMEKNKQNFDFGFESEEDDEDDY